MKKIISLVLSLAIIFSLVSMPASATGNAVVKYIVDSRIEKEVDSLSSGSVYYPDYFAKNVPDESIFVGWQTISGKMVDGNGITLAAGNNILYAVFTNKLIIDKKISLSSAQTKDGMIYLPYSYNGTYYPTIKYELNGGFGPKEEIAEGEDAPYTRFVSGQYNGRGVTLFFDENSNALTGRWNTTYEITVKYRIKDIVSKIQMQPVFGLKKENAQNVNSDMIKDNILKIASTDELKGRWNYDISGGGHEYWFSNNPSEADQYNIVESGFSEWKTVTYTVNTGEENADYLTTFGIYVNVGSGYNANALEIKEVTVTDKYAASVEYVVDGKTLATVENVEQNVSYCIDRVADNTSTHYFAGWYFDPEFKNQARSSFVATGKTILYAKMEEYKDTLSVSSSTEEGEGWEAYKHSLRENYWWCYRVLVGAYGVKNGKYGDLLTEGQAHRHFGSERDGNTAVADASGLKHETRDRDNPIWYSYAVSDYILRDENGEAFIVKPDTTYKVTLTYTFDNSANTSGTAEYFLGTGVSADRLMHSGEMKLYDVDGEAVTINDFAAYGHSDGVDCTFLSEGERVRLEPTTTDKTIVMYITTPSLETYKTNNALQVLGISDVLSDKCKVIWKAAKVEETSVIGNAGVSMLKDKAPNESQALRYYFTYDTTDGRDIFVFGKKYNVVSRGVLLAKGPEATRDIRRENVDSKYVYDLNTTELYKCWSAKSYEDSTEMLYFSCYITNLKSKNGGYNDTERIYARGYVVVDIEGIQYTYYSAPTSCTVKEVAELNNFHNEGEFKPMTEGGRELVWNLEFEEETNVNQLNKKLNTGAVTMSPDRVTIFTSRDDEHYFLSDGDLVLRMTKDTTNNTFTTAPSLTTVDRMSFKYGYLEMRAKMPYQYGMWFSFWMQPDKRLLPSGFKYYGEIDIVETYWKYKSTSFSLHKWYNGYDGCTSQNAGEVDRSVHEGDFTYYFKDFENLKNEYHIYGLEWTPEYLKAYIDGECYYTVYIDEASDYDTSVPGMECFHDYYYLCWNNWMHPTHADKLNFENGYADYAIDYVRLYQNPQTEYIYSYY